MNIRFAVPEDLERYVRVRFDYFAAEGWTAPEETKELMSRRMRSYYIGQLNKSFFAAFAELEDSIVSAAFLTINEMPANIFAPTGKYGTILNVLTYPPYRRKGYATNVLDMLIRKGREEDLSYIQLSASRMGRRVYEGLGFSVRDKGEFVDMMLPLL